jgi:hypothetical protein
MTGEVIDHQNSGSSASPAAGSGAGASSPSMPSSSTPEKKPAAVPKRSSARGDVMKRPTKARPNAVMK